MPVAECKASGSTAKEFARTRELSVTSLLFNDYQIPADARHERSDR